MTLMFNPWSLFEFVELFGVFVGAFSGALGARRHGYNITGLWGLALVTGLGGGAIRDLCLQVGPPLALTEPTYLPVVAGATLAERIREPDRPAPRANGRRFDRPDRLCRGRQPAHGRL